MDLKQVFFESVLICRVKLQDLKTQVTLFINGSCTASCFGCPIGSRSILSRIIVPALLTLGALLLHRTIDGERVDEDAWLSEPRDKKEKT